LVPLGRAIDNVALLEEPVLTPAEALCTEYYPNSAPPQVRSTPVFFFACPLKKIEPPLGQAKPRGHKVGPHRARKSVDLLKHHYFNGLWQ
jgi:hypothetical protein